MFPEVVHQTCGTGNQAPERFVYVHLETHQRLSASHTLCWVRSWYMTMRRSLTVA